MLVIASLTVSPAILMARDQSRGSHEVICSGGGADCPLQFSSFGGELEVQGRPFHVVLLLSGRKIK